LNKNNKYKFGKKKKKLKFGLVKNIQNLSDHNKLMFIQALGKTFLTPHQKDHTPKIFLEIDFRDGKNIRNKHHLYEMMMHQLSSR